MDTGAEFPPPAAAAPAAADEFMPPDKTEEAAAPRDEEGEGAAPGDEEGEEAAPGDEEMSAVPGDVVSTYHVVLVQTNKDGYTTVKQDITQSVYPQLRGDTLEQKLESLVGLVPSS